nr:hypothetical protein [Tanacetum cinerariifolium]
PILYLASLASSWEHAPNNSSILIDREGMVYIHRLKVAVDNDVLEISSVLKNKDVPSFELAVVGEGFSRQSANVTEDSKKRHSIMEALKEEAMVVKPVSKKRKPEGLRRTNMRGCVPPLPTTAPKGAGKHPRVLACYIKNLASSSNSLALGM